jgi:hypothetical protein
MVAVKVTTWPWTEGFAEELSVVVVGVAAKTAVGLGPLIEIARQATRRPRAIASFNVVRGIKVPPVPALKVRCLLQRGRRARG